MSIEKVMKSRGYTTSELARLSGVQAKHLSAYKNGSRTMGHKAATKLAGTLETSPQELLIGNRADVMSRAAKRGDRAGVLNAAKGLIEVADEYAPSGSELADKLDAITEYAIEFAGTETPYGDYDQPLEPLI